MDFYAVLDEVLELLQRHKRVTYRALKRQFGLDDAYLEDLKAEIIEARQLAVDQDGTMLVWCGDLASPPPPLQRQSAYRTVRHSPSATPGDTWPRRFSRRAARWKASASRSPSCSPMWPASPRSPSSSIPRWYTTSSIAALRASRRRCTASRARSTSTPVTG